MRSWLRVCFWLTAAVGLGSILGLLLDERTLAGVPLWLKPLKFSLSVCLYLVTLEWMLGRLTLWRAKLVGLVSKVVAICFGVEWAVMVVQAARGTFSHFNVTTLADTLAWAAMGIGIGVLWLVTALATLLLCLEPAGDSLLQWGIRWGLALTLVGMAQGFLMTNPHRLQTLPRADGRPARLAGSHTIGAPDGGPGFPVVNWSRRDGDLRVAHFFGMHAMQLMPLLGLWLARRRCSLLRLHLTGLAYLLLIVGLTWQALVGQSCGHPLTLLGLGGLALVAWPPRKMEDPWKPGSV